MFLVDEKTSITYPQLFEQLNTGKYKHVLCSILGDIIDGREIYFSNYQHKEKPIKTNITSKEQFLKKIKESNSLLHLNTSGTTGTPKIIQYKISDLLKDVKFIKEKAIWLYTYNPFHMGGLQVLLQAVLNENALVYAYKKDKKYILRSIKKYNVSHISGTPTFYKLLEPFEEIYPTLIRATLGGERVSVQILDFIKKIFPNAKINNIYALTETGAVLFSDSEIFRTNDKTKIIDNILFVKDEKGEWKDTGDNVKKITNNTFSFAGRKANIINIAGNDVNPAKVENVLMKNCKIRDAIVYPKKSSSLGNLLICDVVASEATSVKNIRSYLSESTLEYYEIPRVINLVPKLKVSDNTKRIP